MAVHRLPDRLRVFRHDNLGVHGFFIHRNRGGRKCRVGKTAHSDGDVLL